MRFAFDLVPSTAAPSRARTLANGLAADVGQDTLADLRIIVSELVANAVKYGPGGPIRVELDIDASGHIRGRVAERGNGSRIRDTPHVLERPGAHGGYGLRLVDGLTTGWGVGEDRATVWFELGG